VVGRLLVVGVAWVAALVVFAVFLQWSARLPRPVAGSRDGVSALARSLNDLRPSASPLANAWTVTRASSALGAMVVDVEAQEPNRSLSIAREIVEPVHQKYQEVLIYITPVGADEHSVVRRIQWTAKAGYVETVLPATR
jgi:hypothetical protein